MLVEGEAHLQEAVCRLEKQTFTRPIQLIFVDITPGQDYARAYGEEHPHAHYLHMEGTTAAVAYNAGLELAEGAYTFCMNDGDLLDLNLLEGGYEFMEAHPAEVDFATFRLQTYNEDKLQPHPLSNMIFPEPKIMDLEESFTRIPVSSAIIKTEVLKREKFNEKVAFSAYSELLLRLAGQKMQYGYLSHGMITYHTPLEDNVDHVNTFIREWYFCIIEDILHPLMDAAEKARGAVPAYLQFAAVYHIQWAFLSNIHLKNKNLFVGQDLEDYFSRVFSVLRRVDDGILLNHRAAGSIKAHPLLLYRLYQKKNGLSGDTLTYLYGKNDGYAFVKDMYFRRLGGQPVFIQNMEFENNKLEIDLAFDQYFSPDQITLYATLNGEKLPLIPSPRYSLIKYFGVSAYKRSAFHLTVPLRFKEPRQVIQFYAQFRECAVKLPIKFTDPQSKIANHPGRSYWHFANLIAYHKKGTITMIQASLPRLIKRELLLLRNIGKYYGKTGRQAQRLRLMYWLTRPFYKNKKIWITFDKFWKGGDNGEYFFRYAKKQGANIYYILNKTSPDMKRLRKAGFRPVVNGSLKHKLLFLNCDILLETHASVYYLHGFDRLYGAFFRGLFRFKNVCLQHGLSVQQLALSMNRVHDNLKRYYCASKYEIENNLKHPIYGYNGYEHFLKLTGSPRYDGLINRDQKNILITPTWRMGLALPRTQLLSPYNPAFKDSTYFKVYRDLIRDERLIEAARKAGYSITYLLHPTMSVQLPDFQPEGYVKVVAATDNTNYEKILTEASLMVTDYSGVQFDFAYMRKPVVYYHHTDIPPHYEEGCFHYDTMAFGEICTGHEEMVNTLIGYIENSCQLKDAYRERMDDFFAFSDQDNCKRIYEDVLKLQAEIDRARK